MRVGDEGDETRGAAAERRVHDALRAALPPEYRLYRNARWCAKSRPGGPAHDGEADIVVVHPELGLLVIEVKAGEPSRDADGTWWLGPLELKTSPFAQAEAAKHDLRSGLTDLPDWPAHDEPRAGHAVAFPDVDLASLPRGHAFLGADAPTDLVFDADALRDPRGHTRRHRPRLRPLGRRRDPRPRTRRRGHATRRRLPRPDADPAPTPPPRRRGRPPAPDPGLAGTAPGTRHGAEPAGERKSSGRPAAASRSSPSRRRGGSPGRAFGPCSCASTSRWRRPSCTTSRR